jgi:hypothetical protein
MADYGLRVWDDSGDITLDLTDNITRFRYAAEVAAGANNNVDLPDIDGLETIEISVGIAGEYYYQCAHLVSRSGTTISWTAQSGLAYSSCSSLIFSFLYT